MGMSASRTPARLRAARAVGMLLLVVYVICTAGTIALTAARGLNVFLSNALLLPAGCFAVVGTFIITRRARNRIGWVFSAIGFLWASGSFATLYAAHSYEKSPLPGGLLAAWYQEWFWVPWLFLLLTGTSMLFPDGKLPSERWRRFGVALFACVALVTVLTALDPRLEIADSIVSLDNPVGISPFGDPDSEPLSLPFFLLLWTSVFASLISLVVRFRRARGELRLQMKWFVFAAVVLVVGFLAGVVMDILQLGRLAALDAIVISLPPLAAGVAILKYRLYDIDVVINRTLVYGTLTAVLAIAYLGCVLVLQLVLSPVTPQSDLAVAGSTIAVAALFRPLRARIQGLIDHRFYRHKYDTAQTLDRFSTRLREEVDLTTLSSELIGVVTQTMQPAHASLWLRRPEVT
jgi:hypothetical protein